MDSVKEIVAQIKADNIGVLEFWFVDLLGNIKSVEIPVTESTDRLTNLLERGAYCDIASLIPAPLIGSSVYKQYHQNAVIRPDLATYLPLPWTLKDSKYKTILQDFAKDYSHPFDAPTIAKARFICDIVGRSEFSSRQKLKDYLAAFSKENGGWRYLVGPELEYHYIDIKQNRAIDKGGYLDIEPNTAKTARLREITALMCEAIEMQRRMPSS